MNQDQRRQESTCAANELARRKQAEADALAALSARRAALDELPPEEFARLKAMAMLEASGWVRAVWEAVGGEPPGMRAAMVRIREAGR